MWCCVVWNMAPISDEQAVYTCRRQHLNKILMSIYQTARHHTTDVSNLHSHFLISEDVTRCDYVSLGRLFLTNERILAPSKWELLAHQHTVTCLKTCIFSNTTVRTLNNEKLLDFSLLPCQSYIMETAVLAGLSHCLGREMWPSRPFMCAGCPSTVTFIFRCENPMWQCLWYNK